MWSIRRILCPTDFSACASNALTHAMELARRFQAEVVLLHVVPETAYALRSLGAFPVLPDTRPKVLAAARHELEQAKAAAGEGVSIRTELREGHVHHEILEAAKALQADLVVVGTHGHTGLAHALLGSVAERVVRLAPVPVLTIRAAK